MRGVHACLHSFLTLALDGGDGPTSCLTTLPPGKELPVPNELGAGWAPDTAWTIWRKARSLPPARYQTLAHSIHSTVTVLTSVKIAFHSVPQLLVILHSLLTWSVYQLVSKTDRFLNFLTSIAETVCVGGLCTYTPMHITLAFPNHCCLLTLILPCILSSFNLCHLSKTFSVPIHIQSFQTVPQQLIAPTYMSSDTAGKVNKLSM
jgi:hypothetical protein